VAITKKVRFEVFKRDGFACQYCGKTPPEVTLEIDHIIPKSKQGTDEINNLLTSCFSCNRGKSNTKLERITPTLKENLTTVKEQQKQMRSYEKHLALIEQKKETDIKEVGKYFFNKFAKTKRTRDKYVFTGNWKTSTRTFLKIFSIYDMQEAIDIAWQRLDYSGSLLSETDLFKYMCGILHTRKREGKK